MRAGYDKEERLLVLAGSLAEYRAMLAIARSSGALKFAALDEVPVAGQVHLRELRFVAGSEFGGWVVDDLGELTLTGGPDGQFAMVLRRVLAECTEADLNDEEWHVHLLDDDPPPAKSVAHGKVVDVLVSGPNSVYV